MTTTTITITIEDVESLATQLETEETARRAKLRRLIAAYARILAVREPERFVRRERAIADEDGHYDNSYPPRIQRKEYTGPRLLEVVERDWDSIATETGYYHDWRAVTSEPGLYVDAHGRIFGAEISGTGRLGQFAAYPGNCCVDLTVAWAPRDDEDLPTEDLETVEVTLRKLAFPAATAVGSVLP